MLTSPSKKSYIGWTSKEVYRRLAQHRNNAKRGQLNKLYNAIRKYPFELWKIQILHESNDYENSLKKEQFFIKKHETVKNGYNITHGGQGTIGLNREGQNLGKYHHPKKIKLLLSKLKKGKPSALRGRKLPREVIEKRQNTRRENHNGAYF